VCLASKLQYRFPTRRITCHDAKPLNAGYYFFCCCRHFYVVSCLLNAAYAGWPAGRVTYLWCIREHACVMSACLQYVAMQGGLNVPTVACTLHERLEYKSLRTSHAGDDDVTRLIYITLRDAGPSASRFAVVRSEMKALRAISRGRQLINVNWRQLLPAGVCI